MVPGYKCPESCKGTSLPHGVHSSTWAVLQLLEQQTSTAVTLGISSFVAGTWDSFSERSPMSTDSAAFHAGLVTHPQAWRSSYRVCYLRMGYGLVALQGSSCSNTLEGKTAADYRELENFLRAMKDHLV